MKTTRHQFILRLDATVWRPRETSYAPTLRHPGEFLQIFRRQTHLSFDRLWKDGHMTRDQAYRVLQNLTGLPAELVHIRLFDAAQCADACDLFDGLAGGRATWAAERRRRDHQSRRRGRSFRRRRAELAAADADDAGRRLAC